MAKSFELLALAASFAREHGIALNDPGFTDRFIADATPRLNAALSDSALLYGSRTERLFEATVLSLGQFKLLKHEDAGRVHAATKCRAPDFRIVLDDDSQWLVEVKNVRCENPAKQQTSMSAAYVASLQTYSNVVCAPLRIAIYWSRWNIWTIINPDKFRRPNGGLRVKMADAIQANEFGKLGEVAIMTRPPLRLVLHADCNSARSLDPSGEARFVIGAAQMFSGDAELLNPKDQALAWLLLHFGDWPIEGPFPIMDGRDIGGVEFVSAPDEPSEQGFDGIGWASRIYSTYFAEQTIEGDQIIHLSGSPTPEWFEPLATWDFGNSKLPLWLMRVEPSEPAEVDKSVTK